MPGSFSSPFPAQRECWTDSARRSAARCRDVCFWLVGISTKYSRHVVAEPERGFPDKSIVNRYVLIGFEWCTAEEITTQDLLFACECAERQEQFAPVEIYRSSQKVFDLDVVVGLSAAYAGRKVKTARAEIQEPAVQHHHRYDAITGVRREPNDARQVLTVR